MKLLKLIIVVLLFSCKPETKKIPVKVDKKMREFSKKGVKLTKQMWNELGLFNIEQFNEDYEYYNIKEKENLKCIGRVLSYETVNWLCLFDKNNKLKDYAKTLEKNKNGLIDMSSKIIGDTIIRNTTGLHFEKTQIDTLYISRTIIRNIRKENKVIGVWVNNVSDLKFEIIKENGDLKYIFTSPRRTIKNTAKVTDTDLVIFEGFEWSEYAGGAIDDGDEVNDVEKEEPPLPTEIGCNLNFDKNEFVIQNSGNAMNYYTKIEEAKEKYVLFKKE